MEQPLKLLINIIVLSLIVVSCGKDPKKEPKQNTKTEKIDLKKYPFSADSAFQFIKKQVDFGPRVPGTKNHKQCADYLKDQLALYCDTAFFQTFKSQNYKGDRFTAYNIIGSTKPNNNQRILLCAHWDTRPWSDEDAKTKDTPSDGADDGASGVGVLLEIARNLDQMNLNYGIDFIFFDAEDAGARSDPNLQGTWCLGSQYWAQNPHKKNYSAQFGVLLDMVGAKGATFPMEGFSMQYAAQTTRQIWSKAAELGFGSIFVGNTGQSITDDHYYINTILDIPTVNIIHHNAYGSRTFGDHWHTKADNLSIIDLKPINAVGKTLTAFLMNQ